ncbi:MAG: T9SS type A sorting domain-containing protein [Chitinophagaceae bacterium]|nr:T9SS type A sorting domain-containing protein [Chitinophagaceae bacterium]
MKKLYFFFLFVIQINDLLAQHPATSGHQQVDISLIEGQAHQRLRDVTGNASMDTFTVASDNIDVHHYRCEWQLDPSVRFINGKITVSFTVKTVSDKIIFDLASTMGVDSILYHGTTIPFQRVLKDGLEIGLPALLNAGQKDSVSIFYRGVPDPSGTGVFFQGFHRYSDAMWTLSEPYGAKLWWACKNGLSDKADSIDIIVTHPVDYIVSTNGVKLSEQNSNGKVITHFKHRYPIASYLVAILVAKYTVAKDSVLLGNHSMPVLMYSYPVHVNYFSEATRVAKLCLPKFSDLFGIYPFYKEQYSQTYWAVQGGMEHQTNSFIGDRWSNLISHELGHQWFGDKVTCGSWQDIWLNEGFATYSTNIYYEHFEPSLLQPTLQSQINNITSLPGGSLWVNDTTNIGRLFSGRLTYNKGSYVVHMLRGVLGDSVFFKGVRRYLDDVAVTYSFARTSDLRKVLEAESGKNLESFFQKWVYGEGYPNYHAEWTQNNNNWIKVKLNQTTSHSSVSFYEMPVTLVAKAGSKEQSFVVEHRYSGQEFWLNAGFAVDTVLIDPKLWILSKVKTSAKVAGSTIPDELKIYPNPAPRELKISLKNPSDRKLNIQLLNMLGQTVYQKDLQTPGSDELFNISLTHLPRGVYWLKLSSYGSIQVIKKIVH